MMSKEFNEWWDGDLLTEDNPFVENTAAYWAWEGWCAGVKAERQACAVRADEYMLQVECGTMNVGDAIRKRSNT